MILPLTRPAGSCLSVRYCIGLTPSFAYYLPESVLVLFALTIFLSAALLFLVQPMLAKHLLPYFGGGAAVWTACMLFFQTMLLAGYLYAHVICRCLSPLQQRAVHGLLMLLAAIALSLMVQPDIIAFTTAGPLSGIITFLLLTAGLPYLVLSATGPLLQQDFFHQIAFGRIRIHHITICC